MADSFVHLHLHSQYTLLESSIRIDDLIDRAVKCQMSAVALTDLGNLFGAIEFYLAAKAKNVKPIIGCEVFIAPNGRFQKGGEAAKGYNPHSLPRLVLLAMNLQGYKNLCQIVSRGYTEGFYYKPRIDCEVLKEYSSDLIALTSSHLGDVPSTFISQGAEKATEKLKFYQDLYGDRLYLELQRNGTSQNEGVNRFLIEASRKLGLPLVAANEPHYLDRDEAFAQEILMCIQAGKTLLEDKRPKLPSDQFDFKTAEEMRALFRDIPDACDRTVEVAERCTLRFNFTDQKGNTIYHLPTYPVAHLKDEIKRLAETGLEKRFEEAARRNEEPTDKSVYRTRLEYELSVIDRMGFNGYFLIVQDFINYAKDHGIPVGPGRGSGAGSLVAFSLRITDLDPIRYNLLFERFLNPERISMPDFDVDFCQDRRGEVIDYVTKKYGNQSVAQIITFGKLQARAVIRDVGRAMGLTYGEVDFIAKLVPEKLGITLDEAISTEPKFKELAENDPKIDTLLKTAIKLEGITRHASIHAAGVIISDRPLVEHCPLYKGNEGETVIQYDMVHAEKIGLVKFDFLGLKTLTMIDNAIKMIRENYPESRNFSTADISLSDSKIYELLSQGDTDGIFQFESDGISDLICRFKPNCFEDITAINALYRPGPMNMLDEYVARKQGKIRVTYLFPQLEEILKETYGIIVYQEQVQLIAAKCANYSLGEADILRRAMGKKKPGEMAKQRERFLKGCAENKLDKKKSEELFDLMAKFAEYGFNKSHAAAYCVVAAQTGYLKAYFPIEFYASLITTEMGDTDKVVKYVRDAQNHKIKVRGPDINDSAYKFVALEGDIIFGLGGIKGVGEAAVEAILEAKEQLPGRKFSSLLEFFERVDLRRVNKKVVECLVKAGCFDRLYPNRARLYQGFDRVLDAADKKRRDRELGQVSLFESFDTSEQNNDVEIPEAPDWTRNQRLVFEKEVLGFYVSDHPLNGLENLFKNRVTCRVVGLADQAPKKKVAVGGIVSGLKEFITKKGTRMAFAQLEDQTGVVELVIFSETYAKHGVALKLDKPVIIEGTHERENDVSKILVDGLITLEGLSSRARELVLTLNAAQNPDIMKLAEVLKRHPGELKSRIEMLVPDLGQSISIELGPDYGINASETFFDDLERNFGSAEVATLV